MMTPRFTREQPPELVRAITQAIDRIAPGAVVRHESPLRA
jgi:hypothetical protein